MGRNGEKIILTQESHLTLKKEDIKYAVFDNKCVFYIEVVNE